MVQQDQWHGMTVTMDRVIFGPFFLLHATIIFIYSIGKTIFSMVTWFFKTDSRVSTNTVLRNLHRNAESYEIFYQTGVALDTSEKNFLWKNDPISLYYDHAILQNRLDHMMSLSSSGDLSKLIHLLRGTLIRNFCGISNPNLYSRCRVGTKILIERYVHEVVDQLHYIHQDGILDSHDSVLQTYNYMKTSCLHIDYHNDNTTSMNTVSSIYKGPIPAKIFKSSFPFMTWSPSSAVQLKMDFFSECLQAFGRTALFLTGGITLGLYHLGIAKALYDCSILPRIICGTSIGGALVASIMCTQPRESNFNDGLSVLFNDPGSFINFSVFEREHGYSGSLKRKIFRFMNHGHLLDSSVIQKFLRDNIGNLTFAEAYQRSHMILNIVIPGSRRNGPPLLLNYLTAPEVLVWSAACASGTLPGLYEPVSLYVKSPKGEILTRYPKELLGASTTYRLEEVFTRLSGLFNVNHIILSSVTTWNLSLINHLFPSNISPHSTPLVTRFLSFIFDEFKHRLNQLQQLNFLPRSFSHGLISQNELYHRKISYSYGTKSKRVINRKSWIASSDNHSISITEISPCIELSDLPKIFSPLSEHLVRCLVSKGEKASWPHLGRLKNMMLIESTLDHLSELKQFSHPDAAYTEYGLSGALGEPEFFRASMQDLGVATNITSENGYQNNRKRSRTSAIL